MNVAYSPGEDFYMIDASYSRNMEKQSLTAGPSWRAIANGASFLAIPSPKIE